MHTHTTPTSGVVAGALERNWRTCPERQDGTAPSHRKWMPTCGYHSFLTISATEWLMKTFVGSLLGQPVCVGALRCGINEMSKEVKSHLIFTGPWCMKFICGKPLFQRVAPLNVGSVVMYVSPFLRCSTSLGFPITNYTSCEVQF